MAGIDNGIFSAAARVQYGALLALRWNIFRNALRSKRGAFEFGARIFSYVYLVLIGLAISIGAGVGAYFLIDSRAWGVFPIVLWAIFGLWQIVPIFLASFQEQFDLSILLRFPVSLGAYSLLYVVFGLVDLTTIIGSMCCLSIWVGITVARPELFGYAAAALGLFVLFNILLARAVFAWIDRWLSQRKTREIVMAVFFLLMIGMQLLNPALRSHKDYADQARQFRQTGVQFRHWLNATNATQRTLPPGLVVEEIRLAANGQPIAALESLGALGIYLLATGGLLILRLRSEYRGENLGSAPRRTQQQKSSESRWLLEGSGPISAVIEKELRGLLRTLPMIYGLGAPLVMVLILSGVFLRHGASGPVFPLALPLCILYAQLGFTALFFNNMGTEGAGIQLYFLSPTPIRSVLLAKNIFHSLLYAVVVTLAGCAACLRLGVPDNVVLAATAAWLLFMLPCNLAAGNVLSLTMPYKINPGRIGKQRGSQASAMVSLLVQALELGVGALVFGLCRLFENPWLSVPIFLVLAAGAVYGWLRVLGNAENLAYRRRDALVEVLVKAE
jgi:ABC-2 type transport system permease protein